MTRSVRLGVVLALMMMIAPFFGMANTVQAAPADDAVVSTEIVRQYGDINTGGNSGDTTIIGDGHGPVNINGGTNINETNLTLSGDTNIDQSTSYAPPATWWEYRWDGYCYLVDGAGNVYDWYYSGLGYC